MELEHMTLGLLVVTEGHGAVFSPNPSVNGVLILGVLENIEWAAGVGQILAVVGETVLGNLDWVVVALTSPLSADGNSCNE